MVLRIYAWIAVTIVALALLHGISSQAMLPLSFARSTAKEVFRADKKMMHAKHADKDRLDDLSRRMIGCSFIVPQYTYSPT